eukprot:94698-Alexandrium_andersonii.AAC.1
MADCTQQCSSRSPQLWRTAQAEQMQGHASKRDRRDESPTREDQRPCRTTNPQPPAPASSA